MADDSPAWLDRVLAKGQQLHERLPWPFNDLLFSAVVAMPLATVVMSAIEAVKTIGALSAFSPAQVWTLNASRWWDGLKTVAATGLIVGMVISIEVRLVTWLISWSA
jgi:hypothetical protein